MGEYHLLNDLFLQLDSYSFVMCHVEILSKYDLRRQQKVEREEAAVTCDGRLFHRRAAETGNALSLTVDRRVRRTSRDVDEAESSRRRLCLVT